MTKISVTSKKITQIPKKFVRLVVTENVSSWHRLVECKDETLEYRMGAGKWKDMTPRKFVSFLRSVVQAAKGHHIEHLAIDLPDFPKVTRQYGTEWVISTIVENLQLAAYEFNTYKTKEKKIKELKEILICGDLNKKEKASFDRGMTLGTYVNLARDIANTTGDDMTPTKLGNAAKRAVKGTKASVKVLSEKEIQKLKMGALYAVGKGSLNETKFIVMEYYGAGKPTKSNKNKKKQPTVLIGKGITYDTGGLNVKPSGAMHDMHLDMSGGSSVIAAVACAARLKLKKNIIGLIPAAENAVSDKAMRAGDILTSLSGKTIEVTHTDAEGRLVLADALTYSERYNPKAILDVATLTGASLVALGQRTSAVMTQDKKLENQLRELGEESGDLVWPLPLWDEYKQELRSARADISNIPPNFTKFGGAITAGAFLACFAPKNVPWAHIDIAPRMESISSDKLAKGSTGEPVRLLVKFLETT